ncbi:MAG: ATP-binding protein [Chloroflexota bacterium]
MKNYPFAALVGQDNMQLALLLNAINPSIGGVLIRGEKGTAKSTAVRGLAALLPKVTVATNCPFPFGVADLPNDLFPEAGVVDELRPASLVNLPLGVTEDRLLGTIDLESALQRGEKRFEAGLLAQAHQGVLYIDEVNLLNDHIVDVLLDAAAMGVNRVEREGISVSHPARFILVGTMNPEEGELRPQLLDRFGLAVDVAGSREKSIRTEVVRRRLAFETNPESFARQYAESESAIRTQIEAARLLLPSVTLPDSLLDLIAEICIAFDVDGMRADLVMHKTARTLAAWEELTEVTAEHVQQAAEFALLHRRRRQPFEQPGLDQEQLEQIVEQHQQDQSQQNQSQQSSDREPSTAEQEED